MSAATRVWPSSSPGGGMMPPPCLDRTVTDAPAVTIVTRHVSPQVAAALLGQPRALLTERQVEVVDALKHHCPTFTMMRRLVLSFRTILRVGKVPTLHWWMARATATEIDALQRFV